MIKYQFKVEKEIKCCIECPLSNTIMTPSGDFVYSCPLLHKSLEDNAVCIKVPDDCPLMVTGIASKWKR